MSKFYRGRKLSFLFWIKSLIMQIKDRNISFVSLGLKSGCTWPRRSPEFAASANRDKQPCQKRMFLERQYSLVFQFKGPLWGCFSFFPWHNAFVFAEDLITFIPSLIVLSLSYCILFQHVSTWLILHIWELHLYQSLQDSFKKQFTYWNGTFVRGNTVTNHCEGTI